MLAPKGCCLIVEPKIHVTQKQFAHITRQVEAAGFTILGTPLKKGGRALLIGG